MLTTVAAIGSLATKTVTAWTLAITLSSAPNTTKYYEFESEIECRQVAPFVTEMYLAMGETEVNTQCSEISYGVPDSSHNQPGQTSDIDSGAQALPSSFSL